MVFWILIAVLTAAAIMAVLLPLGRPAAAADAKGYARRVYLDQLGELERDKAQGRIGDDEAEAARAEIARRLIAADRGASEIASGGGRASVGATRDRAAGAGRNPRPFNGFLSRAWQPEPPRRSTRRPSANARRRPHRGADRAGRRASCRASEDGRGWDVIAPVYLRLDRPDDARRAFENAIRLLGSTAMRQSGLGEAILSAEGGIVTADARTAFEAANELDPAATGPRFFLGLAAEQEGDVAAAADGWRTLLTETPADAPWRGVVSEALARVEPRKDGPDETNVAAVQALPPGEQADMIEGMVEVSPSG